jgi:hypothetical protein
MTVLSSTGTTPNTSRQHGSSEKKFLENPAGNKMGSISIGPKNPQPAG